MKAFLSHSSVDKPFVERVYKDLTGARAHFDSETFDDRERSADEIEIAMGDSAIFVLFASKNSQNSKWVQGEIRYAKHLFSSGKIKKIITVLLDDTDRASLPEWLQQFTIAKAPAPRFMAAKIRGALVDLQIGEGSERICLGRDDDVSRLKSEFLQDPGAIPRAIFIAGARGIGRRTLLRKFLSDLFPKIANSVVEVVLADEAGESDFFRQLLDLQGTRSIEEVSAAVASFGSLTHIARTAQLCDLLVDTAKQGFVVLVGESAIVTDSGDLQTWLTTLLKVIPQSPRPVLGIVTRRFVSPKQREQAKETAFYHLRSLTAPKSRELFNFSVSQAMGGSPAALSQVASVIVEKVDGHPGQIVLAARLIAQQGVQSAIVDQSLIAEVLMSSASELTQLASLTDVEELVVGALDEFGLLPAGTLLGAFAATASAEVGLIRLVSFGIVEEVGQYFRLAPYLVEVFREIRRRPKVRTFLAELRKAFVEDLAEVSPGDVVPIEYLDARISAAIRDKGEFESPIVSRAIMPSHLLRIARRSYDEKNFEVAAELTSRALERSITLSPDAIVEALRIKGLSYARLGDSVRFEDAIAQLRKHEVSEGGRKGQFARRICEFLSGFKARLDGNIDEAVDHYKRAYALDGKQNLHILRELAQCLFLQGDLEQALAFANAAYLQASDPPNPFVIDILVEIVVRQGDPGGIVDRLLKELDLADARAGTNFGGLRRADVARSERDWSEALRQINRVTEHDPRLLKAFILRAEIYAEQRQFTLAESELTQVKRRAQQESGGHDKRLIPRISIVEARILAATGRFDEAIRILRSNKLPGAAKQRAQDELFDAMSKSNAVQSEFARTWYGQQRR